MAQVETLKAKKTPHNTGTKRVFENPFLERLTRTHIAVPLTLFTIISSGLIYYGVTNFGFGATTIIGLFIAGMLSFTLLEYVMHRYLFHLPTTTPGREKFVYHVHGVHHDYPKDKDRLAMPPVLSLTLSTIFYFLFYFLMGELVYGFLPGFLMGYAGYLFVHYSVHAFQPPKNALKILWIHHGIHHYKEPDRAFGVSSPLWDVIFRTMPRR